MRDVNEINKKIAELEKQRDALAENTGGFKVGDKVVIEGVVSEIEDSYSHPLKVKMKGGLYDYFRPDHLRHAEPEQEPVGYVNIYESGNGGSLCNTAEYAKRLALPGEVKETAVPLYRTPPDASKRIAELEGRIEKIKAEAKRWKEAYEERVESANSAKMYSIDMVCDLVETRKKIEDLQDMLCKKKFDELVPTGDGDCDKVDWADDAENWGRALNDSCFAFMEAVPDPAEQSMYRSGKTALRAAILKYAALVQAAHKADPENP